MEARCGAVAGVVAWATRRPGVVRLQLVLRRRKPARERLPGEAQTRDHALVVSVHLSADRTLAGKVPVRGGGVGGGHVILAEARVAATALKNLPPNSTSAYGGPTLRFNGRGEQIGVQTVRFFLIQCTTEYCTILMILLMLLFI